ncbi:hypothetical protein H5410_005560 [Solanum commersonii]|uniref:Uncharacterized protein n=1 Tax=Solanum commersonii TaxID=4109 RepID=A0A9J6A6R3_SOLCO|nr:hypothetical protein H5410_005560 [Solanum commersonii]
MAIEELEPEPDSDCVENEIRASLTSLKFEYIDLEKLNANLKEKNKLLSQKVQQLESWNLSNKIEILKLKETGKEKICDKSKDDHEVKRLKNELCFDREKSTKIRLELTRTKYELEQANKWTKSSIIVSHLGNNHRNIKTGIGFDQSRIDNPLLYIICGNSDSKCAGLSDAMVEMTSVDDASTLGESILGVSKITEEVLEDVPCEGEYFGDPIVEQSSRFRLNLGASSEGETMGDPSVEPRNRLREHVPLTVSIEFKDDSIEIRVVNFGKWTMLIGKNKGDHNSNISNCDLSHINFSGSPFTWWNDRVNGECIFKWMERVVVNQRFSDLYGDTNLQSLARIGSDHSPLLLTCGNSNQNIVSDDVEDIFLQLKLKKKRTKQALPKWSKEKFGDIFNQLAIREEIDDGLGKEIEILDFSHCPVKGRRKRLNINKMMKADGRFYQTCWDIVGLDILKVVYAFFQPIIGILYLLMGMLMDFFTPVEGDQLNHLAYADNTIIFTSADKKSLQLIMETLQLYEAQFGQLINKRKSLFYMFNKTVQAIVQDTTRFIRGSFPLNYLGCPIGHAKKKKDWKGRLLSFGGKPVLINHVLQSIPIYFLFAICPPNVLYMIYIGFLLNSYGIPRRREGLNTGLLGMTYVYQRRKGGRGGGYRLQVVELRGGSQVWKLMLQARDFMNQEIWWEREMTMAYENSNRRGVVENENCQLYQATSIQVPMVQLRPVIKLWCEADCGRCMSTHNMIREINNSLYLFAKSRYPWLKNLPSTWPLIVKLLEEYSPLVYCKVVYWVHALLGRYKCNIDSTSKGNHGPSSTTFCIRNGEGNLIFAEAITIKACYAIVAQVKAFKAGLKYCIENDLLPIIMETDSLISKEMDLFIVVSVLRSSFYVEGKIQEYLSPQLILVEVFVGSWLQAPRFVV